MIKKLFLIIPGCAYLMTAFSQNDPNSVLAAAQRKLDSVMKNDPNIKKYANKNNSANAAATMPNVPASIPAINPYAKKPDTAFLSKIKIPDRNAKALASIPVKPMTKKELTGFIGDMKHKIMTAMAGTTGTSPLSVSTFDADGLGNASVLCWYAGNADRALEAALDAAEKDPDNMNVLNNLSGILNLCGFPYKAVPVLDYISQQDPDNSTVNNNLGQAYIEMGDAQKAELYLKKAVAQSQYHPEANYTLACIEYRNGNKGAAQGYCENCLRGAYIGNAWVMLRAINPKAKLMDYVRQRYKQPDFFNPNAYPLPEQCKSADKAKALTVEYAQYKNMLLFVKDKYEHLYKAEADYIKKNLAAQVMKAVNEKKSPFRPFGEFAITVLGDIDETYGETILRLKKYDSVYSGRMRTLKDNYTRELKQVDESFKDRSDKVGEGNPDPTLEEEICKAENGVANKYLPEFASLTEDRQRQWLTLTKDYFNDYAYWCYVASLDDHQYHQLFYQLAIDYLNMLYNLANTELLSCKQNYTYTKDKSPEFEFEEGKCPFKANIDVQVKNEEGKTEKPAKFEIDCEEFSGELEMEDGVSFHFKTTPSGRTTLAFSGGLDKKGKIARVLPVSISGSMAFSLTFGGGQPADVGIKWDYGMKLPGALGGKNSAGWSVSMNSGVEFHGDGKLVNYSSAWASKNIFGLDPPAQQMNSNIKLYNH
ncbi:MAG: tetratricopeptide repeat protein [Bacteroidota bacterium]|nr:tetratricopeptide repeat protein [Bacteroidota bacterium]